MTAVMEKYRRRLADGLISPDPEQEAAALKLQDLADRLARPGKGLRRKRPALRGLYLWGGVGRGKSMLMDLFFASVAGVKKRRVHFHAFMNEVHDFLHLRREAARQGGDSQGVDGGLLAFADHVAKEARLLCFDEFFVNDVADAMILGRLFTALFERGVTVVATSNTAPDDLYRDGLQRDRFLPFIALLKEKTDVVAFAGPRDYRREKMRGLDTYFWPADADAAQRLDAVFAVLADGQKPAPAVHAFKGRSLDVPVAALSVARFDFADLCGRPTSALDFAELARHYKAVMLENIPVMDDGRRNEVVRFITLIDVLYENRVCLIASAAAAPDRLYTGTEQARAFARTSSRLVEMQSREWRERG